LEERERGSTTTLTLAVIASAPVDFVEKRAAYSTCTGELSSAAPRRLEGILFTFHNAVTFTLRHLCEAEGIHGWDVGMHGLGA